MREIVLDTETTGLDPRAGHRIVEIGCVELVNHIPTGAYFHEYVNPERDVPEEAFRVHGLSEAFLNQHPPFADLAERLASFLGEATLVIHNAEFDMGFLNAEFERAGHPRLPMQRTVDTVALARRRFPGAQVNLDALCSRFEIDNSARTRHGALLDAELLAEVYIELLGGRQPDLVLGGDAAESGSAAATPRSYRPPQPHAPSAEELAAHKAMLDRLDDPVWRRG